jgi:hypothetical protein
MGVDVERDFSPRRRHFRKRRHADRNVIANPMSFHDRLIRMFRQQRSSKMRNHRAYCTAVLRAKPASSSYRRANKNTLFLPFPQEVSPLHSFYTTEPHFAVALIFPLPQSDRS